MVTGTAGTAYAFFDSRASQGAILAELPTLRQSVHVPSTLELSLTQPPEQLRTPRLRALQHQARQAGCRYTTEATLPHVTPQTTADNLAAVLNQAYQSPLYHKGEEFKGEIVYLDKGRYTPRD